MGGPTRMTVNRLPLAIIFVQIGTIFGYDEKSFYW